MTTTLLLALLTTALLCDLFIGEPPNALHPVVWMGNYIQFYKNRFFRPGHPRIEFTCGALLVVTLLALVGVGYWLCRLWMSPYPLIYFAVLCYLTKSSFAIRELLKAASRVTAALQLNDLERARFELRSLCSRDASKLDERDIVSAVAASLGENLSDSVIAPFFYFSFFGPLGALLYRAVNTMDAMVGYRGKYEYFGKAAARLDDVLNYIPARLTAVLLIGVGFLMKLDVRQGVAIMIRDAGKCTSINGGYPMAAVAGLCGVAIYKKGVYSLGDGTVTPKNWFLSLQEVARLVRFSSYAGGIISLLTILSLSFFG
jgi:adenosylcobinamide-phosphate synthase